MLVVLTLYVHKAALFVVGYIFRIFNHKHFFAGKICGRVFAGQQCRAV